MRTFRDREAGFTVMVVLFALLAVMFVALTVSAYRMRKAQPTSSPAQQQQLQEQEQEHEQELHEQRARLMWSI